MNYTISKTAKLLGISVDTIRYYEESGLVSYRRSDNGYRVFTYDDIKKISMTKHFRSLGFSIEECKELLDSTTTDSACAVAEERLKEIEFEQLKLKKQKEKIVMFQQDLKDIDKGNIKEINLPSLVLMPNYQEGYHLEEPKRFAALLDSIPISFYYHRISLESMEKKKLFNEYGIGIEEQFAESISLDTDGLIKIPARKYLSTIIRKKEEDSFDYSLIEPLINEIRKRGYRIIGDVICLVILSRTESDEGYNYQRIMISYETA